MSAAAIWKLHLYERKSHVHVLKKWLARLGLPVAQAERCDYPPSLRGWVRGLACVEVELSAAEFKTLASNYPLNLKSSIAFLANPVPTIIVRCDNAHLA